MQEVKRKFHPTRPFKLIPADPNSRRLKTLHLGRSCCRRLPSLEIMLINFRLITIVNPSIRKAKVGHTLEKYDKQMDGNNKSERALLCILLNGHRTCFTFCF